MADGSNSPNHDMLSEYTKVKTESLRFMLEHTTFLADKKEAFLSLYAEYKKEKTHERHKELNAMLREYRYDERWLFLGDGELDQIAEIIQKWKTDTDATRESTAAQTQDLSASVKPSTTNETTQPSPESGAKYSLEMSRGYALEKLGKYNLSISDLQKALTDAKTYTGPINGQFDQATLDAVLAFQKTKSLAVDGLVGIGQTIPALFPSLVTSTANSSSTSTNTPKKQPVTAGAAASQRNGANTGEPKVTLEQPLTFIRKVTYMKDGRVYLTGENGKEQVVSYDMIANQIKLPKNAPENFQKSLALADDFGIFLETLMAHDPTYKSKVAIAVRAIELAFQKPNIRFGKGIINLKPILELVYPAQADSVNGGIHEYLMSILSNPNQLERRNKLYEYIRDVFGQSDFVAMKIIEANAGYFKFPKDEDILKNNIKVPGLKQEAISEIQESIRKARETAASDWKKNYATYRAQFMAANPGATFDEEKARQLQEQGIILATARKEIVYQTLYNKKGLTKDIALLQDILGAGTWDISDKSWDLSKEILGMIAVEAIAIAAGTVTAGAGTYAINALMFGRNAYRGIRLVEAMNTASKLKRYSNLGLRIVAGQGIGFEAGAATTRSLIENGDLTSMHSREGYMQSVLMMGAMHGLGKFFESAKSPQWLKFREGKTNIVPFIGQVTIEGSTIFGISGVTSSIMFDHKDNWTLEQMAQAFLMATIFKGFARIMARKDAQGNIELVPIESQVSRPDLKAFRDSHMSGNVLYDKAVSAGTNHVQIAGLPEGYVIGTTKNGAQLEIRYPNGGYVRFYKDELEQKIISIFRRTHTESPAPSTVSESKPATLETPVPRASEAVTEATLSSSQVKNIDNILSEYKKSLGKTPGSTIEIGDFTLTRQSGGKVLLQGEGLGKEQVVSEKVAFQKVRTAIIESEAQGISMIEKELQRRVSKWDGTEKSLGGGYVLRRLDDGKVVVTEKSTGTIITGAAEQKVLLDNAERVLKLKMEKVLQSHGDEKAFLQVGPDSFAFKGWQEWNGKRAFYNPVKYPSKFVRVLFTMTLRELCQPIFTAKAIKDVLTTKGSPLDVTNNVLKLIALRDIHTDWFSRDAFNKIFGRTLTMSLAVPAVYAVGNTDENGIKHLPMDSGDNVTTFLALNYSGAIWGTLIQHLFTDTQPLTWDLSGNDAAVEVPHK